MIDFEVNFMRILGIDPGYGITGFGLIDAQRGNASLLRCGAITTPAGLDFPIRLQISPAYNCAIHDRPYRMDIP